MRVGVYRRRWHAPLLRPSAAKMLNPQNPYLRMPKRSFKGLARGALKAAIVILLLLAAFLLGLSGGDIGSTVKDLANYDVIQESFASAQNSSQTSDQVALFENNTNMSAWLSVEQTDISYPVAQATTQDPSYYLTRDLWGNKSETGSIYIDKRCDLQGTNILVYGHQLSLTGGMFSPLRTVFNQETFDGLGKLVWTTLSADKEGIETRTLKPLCALKVDKTNQLVQNLNFEDSISFKSWLKEVVLQATATVPDAQSLITKAHRAITLVTCSELRSGQSGRSVVLFVS